MRNGKIANSNISFYDILVKGISSLAAYMRNENVVEVSKTAKYETQFLSYGSILRNQFRKGLERNEILELAIRCFTILFNGYTKPLYHTKNLIDAFEPDCIS